MKKLIVAITLLAAVTCSITAQEFPKTLDWAVDKGIVVGDGHGYKWDSLISKKIATYMIEHYDKNVAEVYVHNVAEDIWKQLEKQDNESLSIKQVQAIILDALELKENKKDVKQNYLSLEGTKYQNAIDEASVELGHDGSLLGLGFNPFVKYRSDNVLSHNLGFGVRSVNRF